MKTKHLVTLSILIMTSLLISACGLPFLNIIRGSGNVVNETREVSGFSEIDLNGFGQLIITQGETESLEIEAEDNVLEQLTSDVKGNVLILGVKDPSWRKNIIPTKPVIYRLSVINLSSITLNGAGDLDLASLETDAFELRINGAGNIEIDHLSADSLLVKINGSANIEISGSAGSQEINFDGAGNYDGSDLQTSDTTLEFNGLGNATVWATETLDITINGGGDLSYYGNPSVTQDINGAGEITNLGEK